MYTCYLSIHPAQVNQNEMKRSEPCPFLYPANPEANNNRKLNKYGGMREKDGDFEKSVYIYWVMSAFSLSHNSPCVIGDRTGAAGFGGRGLLREARV